jgi:hypothetical protein
VYPSIVSAGIRDSISPWVWTHVLRWV